MGRRILGKEERIALHGKGPSALRRLLGIIGGGGGGTTCTCACTSGGTGTRLVLAVVLGWGKVLLFVDEAAVAAAAVVVSIVEN